MRQRGEKGRVEIRVVNEEKVKRKNEAEQEKKVQNENKLFWQKLVKNTARNLLQADIFTCKCDQGYTKK